MENLLEKYKQRMSVYAHFEGMSSSVLIEKLIDLARAPYSEDNSWVIAIISVVLERRCSDHG